MSIAARTSASLTPSHRASAGTLSGSGRNFPFRQRANVARAERVLEMERALLSDAIAERDRELLIPARFRRHPPVLIPGDLTLTDPDRLGPGLRYPEAHHVSQEDGQDAEVEQHQHDRRELEELLKLDLDLQPKSEEARRCY